MSCHAILKDLYKPKVGVILTIRFKITAEIEITKHTGMFCVLRCRRGRVSAFEKRNCVLSFIHCHGICVDIVFFTVNSSINVAGDHLAGGSFMEKALK